MIRVGRLAFSLGALLLGVSVECVGEGPPSAVDFNRDIRPILSDKCFRCHGPDGARRKAKLRLDRREEAVAIRENGPALVPGKPEESALYVRVTSDDPGERMPPHDSGLTLLPGEIAQLRRWIAQGGEYQPHWAFTPPSSPPLPVVRTAAWVRNPVDAYVVAELERQGMEPAPEARKEILLRRVALDLSGVAPSREDLDAFVADTAPDAYEKAVDRLLGSPAFGERMALEWLDAARYADTNGYYTDPERRAWSWRDWVIAAFNRNLPFDRFTIEQLAGDLLPDPTLAQKVATGFNRNHMVSNETGLIDEEYRVGYVVDRVDTTSTVWLGLTVGCARCHDHKFDPISQREYYALFACFNNIAETGLVKDSINPPPTLSLPSDDQERRLSAMTRRRTQVETRLRNEEPALDRAMEAWEPNAMASLPDVATRGILAHFDFDRGIGDQGPHGIAASTIGELTFGPGVSGSSATFNATQYVEFEGPPALERSTPFSLTTWIKPGSAPTGCVISKIDSTADSRGFEVIWYKSQPHINLVHRWGHEAIEVVAKRPSAGGEWHHLAITYDGLGKAAGLNVYVDGESQSLNVRRDNLFGSIATGEPWRVAWKGTGIGFEGGIDELRLYGRPLGADEIGAIYWREIVQGTLRTAKPERTRQQTERLRAYYVAHHDAGEWTRLTHDLASLRREEDDLRKEIVTAPVMQELSKPRAAHVLVRGQYDQPGEGVAAGVPSALGPMSSDLPKDRLGLARWLVAPGNPLTARVIVNRYWQQLFGAGVVRTVNDFGLQGELPSHPQLLDWLAVQFVRSGWDVKGLMRLVVTSATYRQSSNLTADLLARDPDNRLLARGPRYRLPAELIRDQALAIGGLLVDRLGGPSVKPYQPAGLWEAVSYNGEQAYLQDHGPSLYRRSLYTFWKRQVPPPGILTFDGPTRETCTVRRARTNTPLQSLVLMNDVTYVEAARGLAARMMHEGGPDPPARIRYGFRRATGRSPSQDEVSALERFYRSQLASYRDRPGAVEGVLRAGETPADPSLAPCELAAWTLTAGVLLNLDETITQH